MAKTKFVDPVTYLKNVTRSISYTALDITKEMMPAGGDLMESNAETLKEVIVAVRRPKKSLLTLNRYLKRSKIYEAGELAVKATLQDIATGNFYNKERIDEINNKAAGQGGLLDFSDMDINFDELDADIARANAEDESDKVTKGDKFVGDVVAESSFAASQAISKSVVASGQYVARTNKASSMLMYNLNMKGFEMIGKGVGSVNENVAHLVNFSNVTIKDYMEKTLKQHDTMLKLQEEQTVLLKKIHDMQAALQPKPEDQKSEKANRYGDVMSGGTLDFKEYAKLVANNIVENTPLKSLNSMNSAMGGDGANMLLTFAAAPMKAVTEIVIKKAIPDIMKESMNRFNETLSGFFGTLLYRLSNTNEDSFLGSWIKKIFGVRTSIKSGIDTSNYQKGPIPFDGVTKKAIIETIPGYLARIESALTGRDERFYDYKNGSWKDYSDVKRETSNIRKRSVDSATGDMKREIEYKALNQMKWNSPTDIEYFYRDLDKFFNDLYDGKKYFDPTNKKLKGSDFGISDENFAIISNLFRNSQQGLQTAFYGKIMEARDQQNRMMMDLENSGDSIYNIAYNNSGSLNSYDSKSGIMLDSKFGLGNLINQKDKYGKNVFDWLKYQSERLLEIAHNTSGGVGKASTSGEGVETTTFNPRSSLHTSMGLQEQETIQQSLSRNRRKEFEKLYNENQKAVEKLKKKNYPIFDTDKLTEMSEEDYQAYMADLSRSIRVINTMEQSEGENAKNKVAPQFFNKLKAYFDKPGKLIADIFDKADKRLYSLMFGDVKDMVTVDGKPVKSVLELMKAKFDIFFDELTEKIKNVFSPIVEKVKEFMKPFVDSAKEKMRPLMESTKDAFKSAGGWVKNSFKEVYSPVAKLFEADGTWGSSKRVDNIDDVDMLADGTRIMNKTGLAVLSEGEMVIPQNLNPFYKGKRTPREQQRRNEKLVKNSFISKLASSVGKNIPTYADGTTNVPVEEKKPLETKEKYIKIDGKWYDYETEKEVSREEVENYNTVNKTAFGKAGEELVSGTKKLVGELRQIFVGEDSKGVEIKQKISDASSQMFKDAVGEIKGDKIGFGGKAIAGGAIGAGASLLTGGLVSPLLAASLGSAASVVINSKKTQDWLFGTEDENGEFKEGVIPKKLVDGIKKYVPSIAKFGTVGALTAMIPFVPGGPIAGLMVGSAVGFLKNNESFQGFLFGEDGLFGKSKEEIGAILKKKLPNILGGAGLGAAAGLVLGGPFGLLGNMMIGGGLGFLSTNEKFQQALFGKKDENGKTIEDGMVQKLGKWVKKNVLDQLKDFIKPFTNRMLHFVERLGKGAGGFFSKKFEQWVGIPLSRALEEYILKPMKKIASPFLKAGKAIAKIAVSPFSILGGMGRRMQRKDLKTGNSAYLGNAAERLKRRQELGMGNDDFYGQLDQVLQGMTVDELNETSDLIKQTHTERIDNRKEKVEARRQLQRELSKKMGGDFKIKDIKKISNLIQSGRKEEAAKLIQNGTILPIGQGKRFSNAKNTDEIMAVFNEFGSQFDENVKYNKSYEKKLKESLKKQFGNEKIVNQLMRGNSGDLLRLLDKEAKTRTPEENALNKANAEENKFRHTLLDDIKAIRNVLTGVSEKKKPKSLLKKRSKDGTIVEETATEEPKTGVEAVKDAAQSVEKKTLNVTTKALKVLTDPEEKAKMEEESEKKSKSKMIFTKDGPMKYLKDNRGEWIPDKKSETTRDTIKDETAEDTNLAKTATFTEKLSNFFSRKKKDEDEDDEEEKGGLLSRLGNFAKSKFAPILKAALAGIGITVAGGSAMAAAGYGMEKIKESQLGNRFMTWLFGGVDENGQQQEGVLTKVGTAIITKGPEIAARISQFIGNTIVNAANFVANNSEKVGQWITHGIELFTNNIVNILHNAPVVIEAIGRAIPMIINPIGRAIPPLVSTLAENIGPVLGSIGSALPEIGKALGNALATLIRQIPSITMSILQASKEIIPELGKGLWNGIKALVTGILHPDKSYEDTTFNTNSIPVFSNNNPNIVGNSSNYGSVHLNTGNTTTNYNGSTPIFNSNSGITFGNQQSTFVDSRSPKRNTSSTNYNSSDGYNTIGAGGPELPYDSTGSYESAAMDATSNIDSTTSNGGGFLKGGLFNFLFGTNSNDQQTEETLSYEDEYGEGAVQPNTRSYDRNRRNASLDAFNAAKYGTTSNIGEFNGLESNLDKTTRRINEATNLKKEQETYTIGIQDEYGNVTYEQIGPDDPRYEQVKEYYDAQAIANTASGSSRNPTDALVVSAAHAARVGLVGTKSGQKLLEKAIERVAKKDPEMAAKLAKAAAKGARNKADKFTKGTVKFSTWAAKLAKKITIDNPKKRKAILKSGSEKTAKEAEKYTVKGMMKEGLSNNAKNVAAKTKDVLGGAKTSIAEKLKGKTPKVVSKAKNVGEGMVKLVKKNITNSFKKLMNVKFIAKFLKGCGKASNTLLEKILKKAGSAVAKAGGKLAAGLISGGLFNALLATYKFTDGMTNAEAYLKIEDATLGQRVISGLALAINEFVLFGLLPPDWIISVLMDTIGKALGIDEETRVKQEELKELTAQYNKMEGTDFTVEDYNKKVLNNEKGIKGLWNNIKSGVSKIFDKGSGSGTVGTTLPKTVRISGAGSGNFISSLVSTVDPNAPRPILSQVDPRIANKKFGNSTIGKSGCAPSSAAILLNSGENDIDLNDTMESAVKYQNPDGSVRSEYFKDIFSKHGYRTDYIENKSEVLTKLKEGQKLILLGHDVFNNSKTKSPFGAKSHYVVASGLNKGKVTIADPETDTQIAYDKSILSNIDLAISAKKNGSGFGSGLKYGIGGFAGSGGLSSSQVKKNKDAIFSYLVSVMGFSKAGAVGVMANIKGESGFNPNLNEYGNGIGFGLCQWSFGRRTNLEKFAKKKGKAVGSLDLQLQFLKKELDESYGKMVSRMKKRPDNINGAKAAARDFCKTFERPANADMRANQRAEMAKALWDEYKNVQVSGYTPVGGTVSDSSSSSTNDTSSLLSDLTASLMKNVYGEDVMSLFGLSSSSSSSGDSGSTSSGEVITNSNAKTARKWFTETLKGTVTSQYGNRIHPVSGKPSFHGGIDIGAKGGTKIATPVSGKVTRSEYAGSYGNLLVLKDKDGYYHYFAHQQKKPSLSVGTKVTRGQQVGIVGTTGSSTGNHLHYEVRKPNNSNTVNPDSYLESYFKKGGNGSGLVSPYKDIDKEKFDKNGGKGGGSDPSIDINILESLVAVISKILVDTNNIGQIKDLLAEYLVLDKKGSGKGKKNAKSTAGESKVVAPQVNIINPNKSNNDDNVDERKAAILSQLQTLIAQ